MPASALRSGLANNRAGLDTLFRHLRVAGNVDGAAPNQPIAVPGYRAAYPLLWVQAGDGSDLGAADVTPGTGAIALSVDTAGKKLNVAFLDLAARSPQGDRHTEHDARAGIVSELLALNLRLSTVAGANGAVALPAIAGEDNLFALWAADATLDLGASSWAVTDGLLTPTPIIDTTGKTLHVLWLDEDAAAPGNGLDWNADFAVAPGVSFAQLIKGLRVSQLAGPVGAGGVLGGSLSGLEPPDSLLGVAFSDPAVDPLDAPWSVDPDTGGLAYAGSQNLSLGSLFVLWCDHSAAMAPPPANVVVGDVFLDFIGA